ncbi:MULTISPECIES: SMEK domain-containing protein [Elizabethkingia]|uniref:SMEK domain-containing protein n=1 Tax=Elizabethkingia ursingii TaxID=1756150 RepID=A0AAJ3TQK8_9FLAO|nr:MULTISPECIES: SMEK domain-containing protein [Elizabethkingia]AQW92926.1 hypothetical protein BBD30_01325 [Elizabethkingia anophelis]AQX09784.1 hypothetical protein BBD34_14545 [Elizabethkingia ursingii]OPB61462.1 hypothetical protein BAS07_16935 [Elizabethkingia anophelis]OPB78680.1 hypothetical protein BAY32_00645 [Elizabethkingia ursingii]OPB92839.1 hypothetical protein BB021_00090 [Elizabethkingia ursingii]
MGKYFWAFDINKVLEGTDLNLLNLIFDAKLVALNLEKPNYSDIDLGDNQKLMAAFQVTSQMDIISLNRNM